MRLYAMKLYSVGRTDRWALSLNAREIKILGAFTFFNITVPSVMVTRGNERQFQMLQEFLNQLQRALVESNVSLTMDLNEILSYYEPAPATGEPEVKAGRWMDPE